jgi:hypothetical protein
MDWRHGSSGRVPALQVQSPKFKPQSHEKKSTGRQWHTPVILATQEAEIRRITVQSQTGQIICETTSQKNPSPKRLVEWLQV